MRNEPIYKIPESFQEKIRELSQAYIESDVRLDCCEARIRNAIDAGDDENAIKEKRTLPYVRIARKKAKADLWDAIHMALPELDRGKNYNFDADDLTVKETYNFRDRLSSLLH